jgi:hypothetical protein
MTALETVARYAEPAHLSTVTRPSAFTWVNPPVARSPRDHLRSLSLKTGGPTSSNSRRSDQYANERTMPRERPTTASTLSIGRST